MINSNSTNINILLYHQIGDAPDLLPLHREEVLEKARVVREEMTNKLFLKKLPSDQHTMTQIKNMIRKMIADGHNIDMIVLDYIDCVVPDKNLGDEWKSEGSVMRGFEALCHELGVVGWTATQGNRSSISSEVVTTDQMGGSIKKAQIGHVVLSVGKTLEQKEHNLATMTLLKSRIGQDGIIWNNCKFDNKFLVIDTETQTTLLGHQEEKVKTNSNRAAEMFKKRQELLNR